MSEGNLTATYGSGFVGAFSTMLSESGKWYTEVLVTRDAGNFIGVWKEGAEGLANPQDSTLKLIYYRDGRKSNGTTFSSYGASYTVGDVIGIALDQDNNNITFYKNNSSQGQIDLSSMVTGTSPVFIGGAGRNDTQVWNFGQDSSFAGNKPAQGNQDSNEIGDFYYTPPTGFLALCTKNLPDVAVVPSEHFNTITYTGTDADNRAITGVGFQPDFAWFKRRNTATNHGLFDVLRGANKRLSTNLTDAEFSDSNALMSFDSDGYTVSSDGTTNAGGTYVAWNWKANGSGSSNTDGTINTTATSANVDAGFSIIKHTGNATANATIGHGLSKAPELVISKVTTHSSHIWSIFVKSLSGNRHLAFTTAAAHDEWEGHEATTSSVIQLSASASSNFNLTNKDVITYAFHSVDGYSKVGSYTGNGSTDGTFVYTGFRPAWVMWKKTNASGTIWQIFDSVRNTSNPVDNYVAPNSGGAESNYDFVDFTSNGFKHRHSSGHANGSGDTYIYLAFAETPFKNSNAR